MESLRNCASSVVDTISPVLISVKDGVIHYGHIAADKTASVAIWAKDGVGSIVGGTWDFLATNVPLLINTIGKHISSIASSIGSGISSFWSNQVQPVGSSFFHRASEFLGSTGRNVVDVAKQHKPEIAICVGAGVLFGIIIGACCCRGGNEASDGAILEDVRHSDHEEIALERPAPAAGGATVRQTTTTTRRTVRGQEAV